MNTRLALIACAALLATGCEKTDHTSIDKWQNTQKGPGKLKKAFIDEGIDQEHSVVYRRSLAGGSAALSAEAASAMAGSGAEPSIARP